jgi:hypothetical protein
VELRGIEPLSKHIVKNFIAIVANVFVLIEKSKPDTNLVDRALNLILPNGK